MLRFTPKFMSRDQSQDGSKQVGVVYNGLVYTSTDDGKDWTPRHTPGSRTWKCVSSSATGGVFVAMAEDSAIWTSSDFGQSWTARTFHGSCQWKFMDISSNGDFIVAAANPGSIYVSSDSGKSWAESVSGIYGKSWNYLSCRTVDCKEILAGAGNQYLRSQDWGKTWS